MKLTVIGCAGSYAGPHSAASSYLVSAHDSSGREWHVVLDLGSGALGPLQRYVDPADLDALAITHLHADHIADITGLEVYRAYHPLRAAECIANPLVVYGPTQLEVRMAQLCGCSKESGTPQVFTPRHWREREPVRVGPLTITPVSVRHPIETYALRIDGPSDVDPSKQVTLTFSGDSDECSGLVEAARGAELFLCEAAFVEGRDDQIEGIHLTGRRAGSMAAAAGVGQLALTHIPAWNPQGVGAAEARTTYDGPVCEVVAGQEFVL